MSKLIERFRNLGIRAKLLAGYITGFVLFFAISGVTIYPVMQNLIEANIESELTHNTEIIQSMVKATADASVKNYLRAVAEKNKDIVEQVYGLYKQGALSEADAKKRAAATLLSQRIGKTGYIYCLDSKGGIRVHPVGALVGADLAGHEFIQEQLRRKDGYVSYDWKNPGETVSRQKALYMTYFKPWDWIISASSYRDEFSGLVKIDDFRANFLALHVGKTGYAYILDSKGNVVVHPSLTGNIYGAKDPAGVEFVKEIIKNKTGKINYSWQEPGTRGYREKLDSYAYIPEFDWYVVSSSYAVEFYEPLRRVRSILIALVIASVLFLFALTFLYSSYIVKNLNKLISSLHAVGSGNYSARLPKGPGDEFGRLTGYFNEFMEKLQTYHVSLQQENEARKRSEEALRNSERRLADIISFLPDATFAIDLEGRIIAWSRVAEEYTGVKAADMLGKGNYEYALPFYGERRPILVDLALHPSPEKEKSYPHLARAGDLLIGEGYARNARRGEAYMLGTAAPLYDTAGKVTGAIECLRDITERRLAEKALEESEHKYRALNVELEERVRQRTAQAEQANRAKSDFLASMSHEIRTPLNAIVGMSELIDEAGLSKDQAQYLSIMRNASDTLLSLINDILDISKIEAGKVEIESVPFNLEELASKVSEMMSVRAFKKDVEISCKIDGDVPVFVEGDATRLRQVLMNLMGNAVKFVEKGYVSLHVTKQKTEGDRVDLLFSVRDTGIGIPADKLATVFEKFTQADSSTTRKYGGTGLGLPISKRLIELMGGKIWLESEPGVGTVFYFTLGFKPQKDNKMIYLPKADVQELKGRRFLVVDDNLVNRVIIREISQSWGALCDGSADAETGLARVLEEQFKGNPYHGVFVDFNMPGMDGYEFCRRLMTDPAITPKPALALVTSDTVRFKTEDFRALGVNTHIMKPVKKQTLLEGALELVALGKTAQAAVPQKAAGFAREDLPALSLLVADDSEDNRILISSFLKGSKIRLDLAVDGFEALEKFRNRTYDIVFMDIQMPGMDGFETTAKLRELEAAEKRARTKVVALTAMAMREDADKAMQAGCDDYLTKPIRKQAFYAYLMSAGR